MKAADVRRGLKYENALGQEVVVETLLGDKARVRIASTNSRPVKLVKSLEDIAAEYNLSRRLPPGVEEIGVHLKRTVREDGGALYEAFAGGTTQVRRFKAGEAYVWPTGLLSYTVIVDLDSIPSPMFGQFLNALMELRAASVGYADRLQDGQP